MGVSDTFGEGDTPIQKGTNRACISNGYGLPGSRLSINNTTNQLRMQEKNGIKGIREWFFENMNWID